MSMRHCAHINPVRALYLIALMLIRLSIWAHTSEKGTKTPPKASHTIQGSQYASTVMINIVSFKQRTMVFCLSSLTRSKLLVMRLLWIGLDLGRLRTSFVMILKPNHRGVFFLCYQWRRRSNVGLKILLPRDRLWFQMSSSDLLQPRRSWRFAFGLHAEDQHWGSSQVHIHFKTKLNYCLNCLKRCWLALIFVT